MVRPILLAVAVLVCSAVPLRAAAEQQSPAVGSLRLPVAIATVADAIGLHRVDASTLPIDIVRLAFASPDGSNAAETRARAALSTVLQQTGRGDAVPLPLSADTWRTRILASNVPDDRLAAAIFSRRATALVYHALFGMDRETLRWLDEHPDALEPLVKNAGVAAVYARSIRIRNGAIQTPGDNAQDLWAALIGADPAQPAAFITRLLSARAGRVAAFYDAVAHADAAHQAFLIGRAGDRGRTDRAAGALEAASRSATPWTVVEHPFLRPDVDLPVVLRAIAVDAAGAVAPPASKRLWARVFHESDAGGPAVDAGWMLPVLLDTPAGTARRRLDAFAFAQRVFSGAEFSNELSSVLEQHGRFVALLSVLADNGVNDPHACALAMRAAARVEGDQDLMTVFQGGLAIVDAARRTGTVPADAARDLMLSLVRASAAKTPRAALRHWISTDLATRFAHVPAATDPIERSVLAALAGPVVATPVVRWEGQDYAVDLARAELRRLTRVRKTQGEATLDEAIAASSDRSLKPLATSVAALVYALALGEPDGRPLQGGAVWRRHRFGGDGPGQEPHNIAWRVATEVFGASGWHLNGSLLYLHVALAHLSLRRLDDSEMPESSQLSTIDRRAVSMSVALADSRQLTDRDRDAIAAALAAGRKRIAGLATQPDMVDDVAVAAAIGDWRRNSIAWLMANDADKLAQAFTTLEIYRAGGGEPLDQWGGASTPVDGCLCLRLPRGEWEEAIGRPSTGQLGAQFADALLRTAEVLAARKLPAALARDVAAFATCDALDRASPAWAGDWLTLAFAARDIRGDRFDDYIAALTASGPLVLPMKEAR